MKQPNISILFSELAATAIQRGERGIIAMILKSDNEQGPFSFEKASEIPTTMEAGLAEQIRLAFMGYVNPPRRVLGFILPATGYTYSVAEVTTGDDPTEHGWYELDGTEYVLSGDTVAKSGVSYYEKSYTAVTPEEGDSPSAEGWYELVDEEYIPTEDSEVDSEKTYYEQTYVEATVTYASNPSAENWYELLGGEYSESTDEYPLVGKTYYEQTYVEATVTYASNPAGENWYELLGGEYSESTDEYPLVGKTYYERSSSRSPITDYTAAYDYLRGIRFQYLVVPTVESDGMTASVAQFIKDERADEKLIKAVLPNTAADSEGIINVTTTAFVENDKIYSAEQYCSRIAGIIAGTPLTMSATYAPLNELSDCARLTRKEADDAADSGQFVALWDGEKVKMGRAINSLVTTTSTKNTQFKKIKIVDAMDMISDDIRKTIEDGYIGKVANTYSNKVSLIAAIAGYFDALKMDSVIESATIDIDEEANELYLKSRGIDTSEMTKQQIRTANTGSYVYLVATLSMVDAIEDIVLKITI